MAKYECSICWSVYDEEKGLPEEGIEAGMRFEHLDENWHCPSCEAPKEKFLKSDQEAYLKRVYAYENQLRKNMETMEKFGLMNKKLEVELCAFHKQGEDYLIGVSLSPLSVNLIRFPIDEEQRDYKAGEKIIHHFPFGSFEFTAAFMDNFGYFEQCSLFSPALEFADHEAAVATAKEIMAQLQKPEEI